MKVLALYNIKGGVGKTAGAVNLAYLSAKEGNRTLIVDLDPQGACSFYLRTEPGILTGKKSWLKGKDKILHDVKGTNYRNLDILPADFSFRNLDLLLSEMKKPKKRIARSLRPMSGRYDAIFFDCPPNITLVSENIFHSADIILVPLIPTTLCIRTFTQLGEFLDLRKGKTGKVVPFFSMVEKRKKLHHDIITAFRSEIPATLKSQIPYASLIEKMGIFREPVDRYAGSSPAAGAYRRLWKEIKRNEDLFSPEG